MNKKRKERELKELVTQGTAILNEIQQLDRDIEYCDHAGTRHKLCQARADLQKQFNEIFDKVFGGKI